MNRLFTAGLIALSLAGTAFAQSTGGITPALLSQMRQAEKQNPADKALSGALFATDINTITRNAANPVLQDKVDTRKQQLYSHPISVLLQNHN